MQLIFSLFLLTFHLNAAPAHEAIWDQRSQQWVQLEDLKAEPGEIFVLGEQHATTDNTEDPEIRIHHDNQLRWLNHLKKSLPIAVGMEFISYPFQSETDQFLAGHLSEPDFLQKIGWGPTPFEFYRQQILAPKGQGPTLALNAPRELTKKVAKLGREQLSDKDKDLLPPIWERGGPEYLERFEEVMKDHLPPEKLENYFWAHSLWDDTMAWKALARPTSHALTIIVGAFHVEFGHGLPARLKRYGAHKVTTVLQVPVTSWDEATLKQAIAPDAKYGTRADLIWVYFLEGRTKASSQSAFLPTFL